jgi:hypothetical protein
LNLRGFDSNAAHLRVAFAELFCKRCANTLVKVSNARARPYPWAAQRSWQWPRAAGCEALGVLAAVSRT